ncbi:MOSC domain-containing protein [Microlunatus flavus]|uniref:MOSC domain-containing protein YiiM n=1 Tax=Microlunatus flavus TaxID=1036181 RepID=A0A1H9LRN3_9ACTN|nr:MOSC domain-containing protein [Microlunatus flavus]SER14060.1 MOSC domain-containing protein YiiM [Microlunatus flavus]
MPRVCSVNVGKGIDQPFSTKTGRTGIDKRPVTGPVEVRPPGPKKGGLGSGLVGDYIGDARHHGGDRQAVYAFAREDLDRWEPELGRSLSDGSFGENLTTVGIDLADALVGERWVVGDPDDPERSVELEVTDPRVPCRTFAGWLAERGWVRRFTAEARTGTYLAVVRAGTVRAGDEIVRTFVPDHDVTSGLVFRATTTQRELLPRLLAARAYLDAETLEVVERHGQLVLDDA